MPVSIIWNDDVGTRLDQAGPLPGFDFSATMRFVGGAANGDSAEFFQVFDFDKTISQTNQYLNSMCSDTMGLMQ